MSHWNYRMTRQTAPNPDGTTSVLFAVREIYYEGDEVTGWTFDPAYPSGETWAEVTDALAMYSEAMSGPVFDVDSRSWLKAGRSSESASRSEP